MSYLYRFIDNNNNIIYLGKTKDIDRRINREHFTKTGHLPLKCYEDTLRVEYTRVKNNTEMDFYEVYYIKKYRPKYNIQFMDDDELSFTLDELEWNTYKVILPKIEKKETKRPLYKRLLVDKEPLEKVALEFLEVASQVGITKKEIKQSLDKIWIPSLINEDHTVSSSEVKELYKNIMSLLEKLDTEIHSFIIAEEHAYVV